MAVVYGRVPLLHRYECNKRQSRTCDKYREYGTSAVPRPSEVLSTRRLMMLMMTMINGVLGQLRLKAASLGCEMLKHTAGGR